MREWNAETYHRVSTPQVAWGGAVLARLPLAGHETVLDIGCGTGLLTEQLLRRLPRGRAVACDLSSNMLDAARRHLRPLFGDAVCFVQCDGAALPFQRCADAVFSTATFHWVRDHDALFSSVHAALVPGGRMVAQCGGGPNIKRIHDRCDTLMRTTRFAPFFGSWREPWEFADAATTRLRLEQAGFIEVETSLEWTPVVQPDAAAFLEFVANVICRPHLAYLPDAPLRDAFLDELTTLAAGDTPAFELDYWRLNMSAVAATRT